MSFPIQLLETDWCHGNSQLGTAGAAAAAAGAVAVAGDGVVGVDVADDDDWGTPVHEAGAGAVDVAAGVVVVAAAVDYVQVDH